MCITCGCDGGGKFSLTPPQQLHKPVEFTSTLHSEQSPETRQLEVQILQKNLDLAQANRRYFQQNTILALNLLSSPGAGKTTLLEKTLRQLSGQSYVIEGDQATTNDADRIRATGASSLQVNTGTGCHLEADMVEQALAQLQPVKGATVFIENVGNLVCPALFDLGEHARVVIASVTEGEDKPLKYPHMFHSADLVIINKADLLPHLQFDVELLKRNVAEINARCPILVLSATTGEGMADWLNWIADRKKPAHTVYTPVSIQQPAQA
ncbi:hydrogenase nickel incorporation protein HypB [Litorivivens lipolytica]|uniref:Hydrogenase maturation factor HypB n=1 Tax=Litorivivens lipolytica TaxID=1524264 RepID=A0A7W4W3Q0_9GAMM|nr:hydrogenase nickel incorporation protein HypB [Litorivivens lipolytica]MBB3046871.1 hydrogenase nickel incorporation protein HypB [Litorivivens lipolytica]